MASANVMDQRKLHALLDLLYAVEPIVVSVSRAHYERLAAMARLLIILSMA